jgi:hypothetical protein
MIVALAPYLEPANINVIVTGMVVSSGFRLGMPPAGIFALNRPNIASDPAGIDLGEIPQLVQAKRPSSGPAFPGWPDDPGYSRRGLSPNALDRIRRQSHRPTGRGRMEANK